MFLAWFFQMVEGN